MLKDAETITVKRYCERVLGVIKRIKGIFVTGTYALNVMVVEL